MKKVIQLLCCLVMLFNIVHINMNNIKAYTDSGLVGTAISSNYVEVEEELTVYVDLEDEELYSDCVLTYLGPDDNLYNVHCYINEKGMFEGNIAYFDEDNCGEWVLYHIILVDYDYDHILIGNSLFDGDFDYSYDFTHMNIISDMFNGEFMIESIDMNKDVIEVEDNIIFTINTTQNYYVSQGTMYVQMANGHIIDLDCDIKGDGTIEVGYTTFMTDPNGIWKVVGLELLDYYDNVFFYVDEEFSHLYEEYPYELYDFSYLDFEVTMCNDCEGYYFFHDDMILSIDEIRTTFVYNGLDLVEEDYYIASRNESIAKVEEISTSTCTITGVSDGETEIVLYNSNDEELATCKVTVCYFTVDVYNGESAELELVTSSNSKIYASSQYDRFAIGTVTDNGVTIAGSIYYNKLLTVYGKHYGTTCIELQNSSGKTFGNGRVKVNVIEKNESLEVMAHDSMIITLTTYHDEDISYSTLYDDVIVETLSKSKSTYTTTINGESVSYDQYTYELQLGFVSEGEEFLGLYGSESGLLQYIDIYAYGIETIELDKDELELNIGDTYQLTYTTTPMNVSEYQLHWSSSNEDVVSVEKGKLVAKSAGTAIIRLNTIFEGLYASCVVTVKGEESDFPFTDVYDYDWYKEYVNEAYQLGLMTGASDTLFKPKVSMNRGMVAIVLHRMEGEEAVEYDTLFPDVKAGEYYAESVIWAKLKGVINGYGDGTFRPLRLVTREEMAQMIYNFAKYKGVDVSADVDLSSFLDGNKVSSWHKDAMMWANANGLITGKYNGTKLDPQGTATRAECCKMLVEAYKTIYK